MGLSSFRTSQGAKVLLFGNFVRAQATTPSHNMRILTYAVAAAALLTSGRCTLRGVEFTPEVQRLPKEPVWVAHLPTFSDADYETEVERLISSYEKATGKPIAPGAKKK